MGESYWSTMKGSDRFDRSALEADDRSVICVKRIAGPRDQFWDYKIMIDGEVRGRLGEGKSACWVVAAGRHEVSAKTGWLRSPSVLLDLEDGVEAALTLRATAPSIGSLFFKRGHYMELVNGEEKLKEQLSFKSEVLIRMSLIAIVLVVGYGIVTPALLIADGASRLAPVIVGIGIPTLCFAVLLFRLPSWLVHWMLGRSRHS
jgi:hypothetical protein